MRMWAAALILWSTHAWAAGLGDLQGAWSIQRPDLSHDHDEPFEVLGFIRAGVTYYRWRGADSQSRAVLWTLDGDMLTLVGLRQECVYRLHAVTPRVSLRISLLIERTPASCAPSGVYDYLGF